MKIGTYDIQPICIFLPDEQKWRDRHAAADQYFKSQGIEPYYVCGIHAEKFGLQASRPYLRDNPEQNWHLEPRTVGNYLSVYMIYNIAISHPEWTHIMYIEDDTRFIDGWEKQLQEALLDVPPDFDWLFVSHCCTEGRETKHVAGNVYEVKYPQAGHVSIIANKALTTLISFCRDSCFPMDIDLYDHVFDKLKVFTVLPRLATQINTYLPQ